MKLKSLEYQLRYAASLAKCDPNARVVIAVGNVPVAKAVFDFVQELAKDHGFTFHIQSMEARHEDGGTLKVLPVCGDLGHYGGWLITHLWLHETLSWEARAMIQTRLRSSKQHAEPPGVYDEYGVIRRMDY